MKQQNKIGLIALGIVVGGTALAGVVVGGVLMASGSKGGSPIFKVKPSDEMTVREFADVLKEKGAFEGNTKIDYMRFLGLPVALVYFSDKRCVEIIQFETAQKAKEMSAASSKPSFSSGRFSISGEQELIDNLQKFAK